MPRDSSGELRPKASAVPPVYVIRPSTTAVLCLTLVISCPTPAWTQSRFESWTTENGLPQNSIRDILQTRDGYLWLATEGGLVRFDGARFVVFDKSVPGFGSQRIGALREDRTGALWAGTSDGTLIRYHAGRFTTYSGKEGLPMAGVPGASVARIEEDDAGSLWVTWIDAVTRLAGPQITNFVPGDFGMPGSLPRHLYLDSWWRQDSAALHVFARGRVHTYTLPRGVAATGVTGVNTDAQGDVWIRTAGAGVLRAADGRLERFTVQDGLPDNVPDGLFHGDGRGSIWFFERGTSRTMYRIQAGAHERIEIGDGRSFYVDREGSTWIGTVAHGLHRLRDDLVTLYTEREGLSLDPTYSILQDRSGTIWIGTGDGGLNKYADRRFTAYGTADGLPSGRITCIYEDRTGRLWVGTDAGLTYLEGSLFTRYTGGAGLPGETVWALHEDRHGTLWFGTSTGLVKRNGDRFTRYTTADGLTQGGITALFEDRSGALWIGTYSGVTRLRDGVFTSFGEPEGFVGNEARAFHEDSDGHLWIGTYDGGLYRLVDDRLTRYTRREGCTTTGSSRFSKTRRAISGWARTGVFRE